MHINIAISKAMITQRDNKLKANNLGGEIIYQMTTNHSIQQALQKFGVKSCDDAFFAVYIDCTPETILQIT